MISQTGLSPSQDLPLVHVGHLSSFYKRVLEKKNSNKKEKNNTGVHLETIF